VCVYVCVCVRVCASVSLCVYMGVCVSETSTCVSVSLSRLYVCVQIYIFICVLV